MPTTTGTHTSPADSRSPANAARPDARPAGKNATPNRTSTRQRNISQSRRNWAKVEDFLTKMEKVRGLAKAWELRERLERGEVSLADLAGR